MVRQETRNGLGLVAERLCLDFINTEGIDRNGPPDRLENLEIFRDWAVDRGLVDRGWKIRIREGGDDFLEAARELREALYRIVSGHIAGETPSAADMAVLQRQLAKALPHLEFAPSANGFAWALPPVEDALDLLPLFALSATELLRSDQIGRVKECNGETCSWMFIDGSRNRSRRWCDMADCGNREKARRFYRRHAGGRE